MPKPLTAGGKSIMLTREVMRMRWRLLLLLPALLLTAAANLRLQWDCELAGEALAKGCAGFAVQKALRAARTSAWGTVLWLVRMERVTAGCPSVPRM